MWMGHFNGKIGNAHVAWPGSRGSSETHIWNQRPQFACSVYNFYGATTTIRGSLHGSTPFKAVFGRKFVKIGPKMAGFRELRGVNVKVLFSNPEKAHPCAEPRCLSYYAWKLAQWPGCRPLEEPRKKEAE